MTDDSSPCLAHRLVDGHPVDPETARDVARFRRAERARLMALRRAMSVAERADASAALVAGLRQLVPLEPGRRVALYWPIRGEPDLRAWMTDADAAGVEVLLPVVVEKGAPLIFRRWNMGCDMVRGIWNIPVPAEDAAVRQPEIVIAPLLGADDAGYRLGNGGGYYDRTLARLDPMPRRIGVGFSDAVLPTIYPMPWDIPMDEILLADGSHRTRQ
ncbi:5-formyltetrahydrofolate cyclo-ligase [Oceanicola granulosus]|nr:5-formyltetrahydrofolate cyclo-ligase [Oceanicola granulosus]